MQCNYTTVIDNRTLFCHADAERRIATNEAGREMTHFHYACDVHFMKVAATAYDMYEGPQDVVGRNADGHFPETLPINA